MKIQKYISSVWLLGHKFELSEVSLHTKGGREENNLERKLHSPLCKELWNCLCQFSLGEPEKLAQYMSCGASTAIMGDSNITASPEWCYSLCWHRPVVPFPGQQQKQVKWLEHIDPTWINSIFGGEVNPTLSLSIVLRGMDSDSCLDMFWVHCAPPQAAPVCNDLLGFPHTILNWFFFVVIVYLYSGTRPPRAPEDATAVSG